MDGRNKKVYIAIDLKSFYASCECVDRGLDPLGTNLVVADAERTEKTICLAVSPSLKSFGIPGRPRLFEVIEKVRHINAERLSTLGRRDFSGSSSDMEELIRHPEYKLDFIIARPRMALYMEKSTEIYGIYLRYIAPEDICVYSIDEVFIDASPYLHTYGLSARELASKLISEVLSETGITATAGIGTNLYLCKIAMDIEAKHMKADRNGVRIAELDESSYRRSLWDHRPITDFWRVGRGTARRLAKQGIYTMGDIARCSIGREDEYYNAELLYKLFGVNAELLIDHAWGMEPCSMKDIKAYRPESRCLSSGQVLQRSYAFEEARTVICEMADAMASELAEKRLFCRQLVLNIEYDTENLMDEERLRSYEGRVRINSYGKAVPVHAHGTVSFVRPTRSPGELMAAACSIADGRADRSMTVRKIYLTAGHIMDEQSDEACRDYRQLSLFDPPEDEEEPRAKEKERSLEEALLSIRARYGKNAVLRGLNYREGATMRERNMQIGGHRA